MVRRTGPPGSASTDWKPHQDALGRYENSTNILIGLKKAGITGGIYTQTSDIEREVNGLMNDDREVHKFPASKLIKLQAPLLEKKAP